MTPLELAEYQRSLARAKWLCPLRDEAERRGFLEMDLDDYLNLLDWTGRKVVAGKKGSIPEHFAPILQRLDVEGDQWLYSAQHFGSLFYRVSGKVSEMKKRALASGQKWVKGIRAAQLAFLPK